MTRLIIIYPEDKVGRVGLTRSTTGPKGKTVMVETCIMEGVEFIKDDM